MTQLTPHQISLGLSSHRNQRLFSDHYLGPALPGFTAFMLRFGLPLITPAMLLAGWQTLQVIAANATNGADAGA